MREYRVVIARSARKELENLPTPIINRIFPQLEALAKEPRPCGCCKLQGTVDLWRIRIGEYRVIYGIDDRAAIVDITAIGHRKEVYR